MPSSKLRQKIEKMPGQVRDVFRKPNWLKNSNDDDDLLKLMTKTQIPRKTHANNFSTKMHTSGKLLPFSTAHLLIFAIEKIKFNSVKTLKSPFKKHFQPGLSIASHSTFAVFFSFEKLQKTLNFDKERAL